jgi:hypothetical protein
MQSLRKQRGSITLLGIGSIVVALSAFGSVVKYGNAKLLDRELDQYANDIAVVALRSELALTRAGIDSGDMDVGQTKITTDAALASVGMSMPDPDDDTAPFNLEKKITFGNFAKASICNSLDEEVRKGCFIPLESNKSNPRAAKDEEPVEFSAVAVRLVSSSSFMDIYTPEGRALYGLSKENTSTDADPGCYCKNRYKMCVGAEDDEDAPLMPAAGSSAREKYCNFGYTKANASNPDKSKYPYAEFHSGWIGKPSDSRVSFFDFIFNKLKINELVLGQVLSNQPAKIEDGRDLLDINRFWFWSSPEIIYARSYSETKLEKRDVSPAVDYRCKKRRTENCNDAKRWNDVLFSDSVYIGYQGTCVTGTGGVDDSSKCLAFDDSGTTRYESCLEIERRTATKMNFFERMMAFFFGPVLNWERSYEGLNCEMQKMQYKGWMFWGGWKDV